MTFHFNPDTFGDKTIEYVQYILDRDNMKYEELTADGRLTADLTEAEFSRLWESVDCEFERRREKSDVLLMGSRTAERRNLERIARLNGIDTKNGLLAVGVGHCHIKDEEPDKSARRRQNEKCDSAASEYVWTEETEILNKAVGSLWKDTVLKTNICVNNSSGPCMAEIHTVDEIAPALEVHPLATERTLSSLCAESLARLYPDICHGSGISEAMFADAWTNILKDLILEKIYGGVA